VSEADDFVVREATAADMPGISHVRLSVKENALSVQQLTERGITNASVAASLLTHRRGWVAERSGEIVAFSMADKANGSIFALFVLAEYEGRGLGSRLLTLALDWLWDSGAERVWLSTSPGTRAARFYAKRGWSQTGEAAYGDVRFEITRPTSR
jgi:GNAT superfamily N-acetyltransferase